MGIGKIRNGEMRNGGNDGNEKFRIYVFTFRNLTKYLSTQKP